ncbi:MAG: hypothetical protein ACPG5B_17600 [Chitinophagales bacterium]
MAKSRNNRKKKKKNVQAPKRLTPEQYIFRKARSLPITKIYISDEEAVEEGICSIFLLRQQPSGNYVLGIYLVDLFCLGVKDAFYRFGITWNEFGEILEHYNSNGAALEETSPEYGQGVIKSALEYAAKFGIQPHKDFKLAQYILDDMKTVKKAKIKHPEVPKYLTLRAAYNPLVIAALNKSVGEGNYEIGIKDDVFEDEWDMEDDY